MLLGMRSFICCLFSLFLVELVPGQTRDCYVGDWINWTSCLCASSKRCPADCPSPMTWPKRENRWDSGRSVMAQLMKMKEEGRAEVAECLEDGTCPELITQSESGAVCQNGKAGIYPCMNADLVAHIDMEGLVYNSGLTIGLGQGTNDMWGWTDPETNEEYAIVGLSVGTSFVRVSDPINPKVVAFVHSTGKRVSSWRDMKVVKNHVFIVADGRQATGHGVQVVDLTRLRGKTNFSVIEPDLVYHNVSASHNIVANEQTDYIYAVGLQFGRLDCSSGLHMINVEDPKNPRFAGCYSADGYTHDAQCVVYHGPDRRYTGKEICFNYNEDTLTIVDVSDKSRVIEISKTGYAGKAYTHQGWLTDDHSILLMGDEFDEVVSITDKRTITYIWDVQDLSKPEIKRIFRSQETAIDHNQYIKGKYVYQSNYEAGLRILELDQKDYNLREVAYFDVYPPSTVAMGNFRGTWSNYPYFTQGAKEVVAVTSREFGLFLVKPNWQNIQASLFQRYLMVDKRWRFVFPWNRNATCPATIETRACTSSC